MEAARSSFAIDDFFSLSITERRERLLAGIQSQHSLHFQRNASYRNTLTARGVKTDSVPSDLALLLRPAAVTFKSYVERMGPFPQDEPLVFLQWLREQVSLDLPQDRLSAFKKKYATMEALLLAIEQAFSDLGLELVTSTGTSGRASVVARDQRTVDLSVHSFFSAIARSWGIARGTALIFVMPRETRVAMARTARFGTRTLDWTADSPVYYTMPFKATPDLIRIRAGRTFRPGWRGQWERRVLSPWMGWANRTLAEPRVKSGTLSKLRQCAREGRPLMLLGGFVQLHSLTEDLTMQLPTGSRIASGGGMKELYPVTVAQIREDLKTAFPGTPVSDVYGMAEANWAAFECAEGNHHVPPWVYAVVTDDRDRIVEQPVSTGLLAFFDPIGGGDVIPPFFQTTDMVTLVNGGTSHEPDLVCPCGYDTPYIRGVIQRIDLAEEAGCAAQI